MVQRFETPFEHSYWVVPGKVLAGCYPGDIEYAEVQLKIEALLDLGIRHFISLMEENELDRFDSSMVPYEPLLELLCQVMQVEVRLERIPVPDLQTPSREGMRMILDRIDAALGEGRPVYIHCRDGIGRTGTVVGCYLARHGIASGRTALEKLQDLRQNNETAPLASPETEEQCRLVLSWERGE